MLSTKVILAIVVAVIGSNGMWSLIQHRLDRKDSKEDNIKAINCNLDEIKQELKSVQKELENTKVISTATARDRLNELSNKYLELGYIPKEEYISYKLLGETYLEAGGNSEVAAKFNLCIDTLDIR